jgi:hypothetical protein
MGTALKRYAILVLLVSSSLYADERLGVLEFFARGSGAYCIAAAPSILALQQEMQGRALVLEYPYDAFSTGTRVKRFFDSFSGCVSCGIALPLVVVGSGFDVAEGPVEYAVRYRSMLEADLARPPGAAIQAWSRRSGNGIQVFATVTNTSGVLLPAASQPTVDLLVWEDARIGLTNTFMRGTQSELLSGDLAPGESRNVTFDAAWLNPSDWQRVRSAVLFDNRPQGTKWDMLQAAVTKPVGLSADPTSLTLSAAQPEITVTLAGPHVLTFSATSDVDWLSVTPPTGAVPARAAIRLVGSPPAGASGTVRFAATGDGMDLAASVVVTAAGPVESWSAVVPAVAHTPGGFGSVWRTDLAAVNESSALAGVTLTFIPTEGESVTRNATLPPGGTREWSDVLVSLFGVPGDAAVSGVVQMSADRVLFVSSKTYNQADNATYGGHLPAITAAESVRTGTRAVLAQLARTPLFRTNVALTNLGETAAGMTIRLYGSNAEPLGVPIPVDVPARALVQVVDVFAAAGAGDRDLAYATVEATTPGAMVWTYASVVDNRTGDPTFIPPEIIEEPGAPAALGDRTIPSVGHTPGAFGSLWRSDVALVNLSSAEARVELRFVAVDGSGATRSVQVPPGTVRFEDILISLFGLDAESPALGALHLRSDSPLVVSSRTFNETDRGTFGSHLPGIDTSRAVTVERPGVIPQLKRGADVRTNVGLTNLGASEASVGIRLRAADGCDLGSEKVVTIPPYGFVQENDVFASCGTGDAPIAWARIEVKTEGGRVFAFASVVDNRTSDPTMIPVIAQEAPH